jgi:hypothetical protein
MLANLGCTVARFFSLRGSAAHSLAFAALGFGLMLGATVEDALDGDEEFGEVGTGPFCEARNKRFNHEKSFTV